jgi:pescadillo
MIQRCQKLEKEFLLYITKAHALRKVFLSIKGIYYQAEILGEKVTWISPYDFTITIPNNVDVRVMVTCLEFYTCLLGFVNFRLYHSLNLRYPPIIDELADNSGAGLLALRADSLATDAPVAPATSSSQPAPEASKPTTEPVDPTLKVRSPHVFPILVSPCCHAAEALASDQGSHGYTWGNL